MWGLFVNVFKNYADMVFGTEGLLFYTWLVSFQWGASCRIRLGRTQFGLKVCLISGSHGMTLALLSKILTKVEVSIVNARVARRFEFVEI